MSTPEPVSVRDEERVRWIVLDRPESKNALTVEVNRRIIAALEEARTRRDVRVVVLTGAGGNFCSGLDLRAAMAGGPPSDPEHQGRTYFHGLIRAVRACPQPVIALVDGAAVGYGCDLALACDLRVGTERTRFGEVFIRRGLMPDGGGTWTLPRLVGLGKALELMLTGDIVEADEAARLGLVSRRFPSAEAIGETGALAKRLAAGAPMVHARVKAAIYRSAYTDLDSALENELRGQLELLRSQDFVEGVAAFFAKREPDFKGE
jgi:enoyl-CoA hydratase/carnithine racemase